MVRVLASGPLCNVDIYACSSIINVRGVDGDAQIVLNAELQSVCRRQPVGIAALLEPIQMADPSQYEYPSPLKGYEGLPPLPE